MEKKYKYVSLDFKLHNEKIEERMLLLEVEEKEDQVVLLLPGLGVYFEEQLHKMAIIEWPNKEVKIGFRSDIPLDFHSFRDFKREVFN